MLTLLFLGIGKGVDIGTDVYWSVMAGGTGRMLEDGPAMADDIACGSAVEGGTKEEDGPAVEGTREEDVPSVAGTREEDGLAVAGGTWDEDGAGGTGEEYWPAGDFPGS